MNISQLRSNALKIKGELKKCQTRAGHLYDTALIHYNVIYKLADLVEDIINTMDEKDAPVSEISAGGDTHRKYITSNTYINKKKTKGPRGPLIV